jgi:ribokinase
VTRAGTAPSMPTLEEINAVLGERPVLAAQSS